MAEKKLSEELRHCLEDDACGDCQYHKPETKLICKGLLQKAHERIKEYEEMFPCKVGDIVYEIFEGEVLKRIVRGILLRDGKVFAQDGNGSILGEFYKTVFLTRSEAEQKLKEMEDRKNGEIDSKSYRRKQKR